MSDDAEMSPATRAILRKVARMIPPMKPSFHKGQLGRVGVIGGSEDYTGAPYFSAMASAKLGCDMSHVICTPGAAAVIKTYSPNLMVHPLMRQASDGDGHDHEGRLDRVARRVEEMLPRLHVLVVGPGLGRDPLMQSIAARTLAAARARGMPAVIDADGLLVVAKQPDIVRGWREAILTPNVVEFERLCKALGVEGKVDALARALGGVTVVQKGREDLISDGEGMLVGDVEGGRKRSGGQGDTLTGAVATFLAWRRGYMEGLWGEGEEESEEGARLGGMEMMGLAAFGGSAITRECSRLAFLKKGRSLQASDLTEEVHNAFLRLFGDDIQDRPHR